MASSLIDSILFKDMYGTDKMRKIWDDQAMVQYWLDVEAALAESQAELGIIPETAAREIVRKAHVEFLDLNAIYVGVGKSGHSLVPTLREFQRRCESGAGEYIHFGATTQDIIDTGLVLASQKGFDIIYQDLYDAEEALLQIIETHKHTVMAGRTRGQQAMPITFGFKAAIWAAEIHRHLKRMSACRKHEFVGQMCGAVGTMAGFGEQAMEVQSRTMRKLELCVPDISWQPSRDQLITVVNILATMAGSLGKMGKEIATLQKTEFSELAEPWGNGAVGSSTMPHKRNPTEAENMHCLAKLIRGCMSTIHDSMIQEHERDSAAWKIEWAVLPETFIYASAIAEKAKNVFKGLHVYQDKMEENLNLLKGLLLSEAVMLHLGKLIGKQSAHVIVHEIAMRSLDKHLSFRECLLGDERVAQLITGEELDAILDPHAYIGHSVALSEKIITQIKTERQCLKPKRFTANCSSQS